MKIKKQSNRNWTLNRFMITGLFILFLISFVLLSSNVYAVSFFKSDYNAMLQLSLFPSNETNEPVDMNHSQMLHMNMNQTEMMKRGDVGMGFNQSKISHQFLITTDGGKIIVTALDSHDNQTIDQIRDHIVQIQKLFSEGNFTMPFFVHAQEVPGTDVMKDKNDLIDYTILELKNGSSLILTTKDKEVVDAISQFMKFQATEHKGH